MKLYNAVMVVAVMVGMMLVAACGSSPTWIDPNRTVKLECMDAGGEWADEVGYSDRCCAGGGTLSMTVKMSPLMGACDCGEGFCYDGYDCVEGESISDEDQCGIPTTAEEGCAASGGTWEEFSDGCADACGVTEDSVCTQALTMSCNCGDDRCWNSEALSCVNDDVDGPIICY